MSKSWDRAADEALERRLGIVLREISDRRYRIGFAAFLGILVIYLGLVVFA